jgi:predicted metal-binding protein
VKSEFDPKFHNLLEIAQAKGATEAKIMPAQDVVLDERVRLKCEVPLCSGFGQYLTCPPYVMSMETFSRILALFDWSMLVQVEAKGLDSTDKASEGIDLKVLEENDELHRPFQLKLLEVVESVERAAFKHGLRFATGFVGGSCVLCEECVQDKTSDACRHPFRARPPMEAVGIDVIKTAETVGLPIQLSSSTNVRWTGLILLE